MFGIHPIRMAQHLEKQGMHPIDAMIHSLAHHIASQGNGANIGRISNAHPPRGRGPINNNGSLFQNPLRFFH